MTDSPAPFTTPSRVRGEETLKKLQKRGRRLRRRLRRAGDVVLILLALTAAGFFIHSRQSSGSTTTTTAVPGSLAAKYPPANDVSVSGCAYLAGHFTAVGTLQLTNHTNTKLTYYVDVNFMDGTQRYTETVARSVPLAPGHHLRLLAWSNTSKAPPTHHLICTIKSVQRF